MAIAVHTQPTVRWNTTTSSRGTVLTAFCTPLTAPQSSARLSMPTSCERQANTEPFSDFSFGAETQMFCPGWL